MPYFWKQSNIILFNGFYDNNMENVYALRLQ